MIKMIKMIKAKLKKQFPILSSSRKLFDNVMYKWGFFSISPTQNCQNLIGQWEALVKQSEEPRNIIGSNANDNCFILFLTGYGSIVTGKQTNRQTDRQTDRQTNKLTK